MRSFWISLSLILGHIIVPIDGIDRVTSVDSTHTSIYTARGICRFQIQLPPNQAAQLAFYYSADTPLPKIEGLEIFDNTSKRSLAVDDLLQSGRIRWQANIIEISSMDSIRDWTVRVIDRYR